MLASSNLVSKQGYWLGKSTVCGGTGRLAPPILCLFSLLSRTEASVDASIGALLFVRIVPALHRPWNSSVAASSATKSTKYLLRICLQTKASSPVPCHTIGTIRLKNHLRLKSSPVHVASASRLDRHPDWATDITTDLILLRILKIVPELDKELRGSCILLRWTRLHFSAHLLQPPSHCKLLAA